MNINKQTNIYVYMWKLNFAIPSEGVKGDYKTFNEKNKTINISFSL